MTMDRYQFLDAVHSIVQPEVYLEIGVQHGWSLDRAKDAKVAFGIDPQPLVQAKGNQQIFAQASDRFFSRLDEWGNGPDVVLPPIDMAFIDGLHHFDQALRDFMNVERHSRRQTVVLLDDMLPRNQLEANREMCPGDWTGDVWKVYDVLTQYRPDLDVFFIDTFPTGMLGVLDLDRHNQRLDTYHDTYMDSRGPLWTAPVPDYILNRSTALSVDEALERIRR